MCTYYFKTVGVELKPGISTRISFKGQTKKVLRITQVYVNCKVAGKDQIRILCLVSLLNYSCKMDLVFEPSNEAELLVHGVTSVHMAGYFIHCEDLGTINTKEEVNGWDGPTLASLRSPDQCGRIVPKFQELTLQKLGRKLEPMCFFCLMQHI